MRLLLISLLAISMVLPAFGQETADDLVKKGNELRDQGKYSDAIQAYDKALEIDPQCAEASTNKVFALRYERKARPETGTYVKDTARNGHGELTIVNGNRTHDVLASLTRPDNETLISVFIRAGESFTISGIDDGEYNVTFSDGYQLDQPITFETTSESTLDKKMVGWESWTFWYTSWTITLAESGPTSITKETKVEEREVRYRNVPSPPDMSGMAFIGRFENPPMDEGKVPLS